MTPEWKPLLPGILGSIRDGKPMKEILKETSPRAVQQQKRRLLRRDISNEMQEGIATLIEMKRKYGGSRSLMKFADRGTKFN
jgi:hypothetical protein